MLTVRVVDLIVGAYRMFIEYANTSI